MEAYLRLGLLTLSFLAGWALTYAVVAPTEEETALARRLQRMGRGAPAPRPDRAPLRERALAPVLRDLRQVAVRWTPTRIRRQLQERLEHAGRPLPADSLLAAKLLGSLGGMAVSLVWAGTGSGGLSLVSFLAWPVVGYCLPDFILGRVISRRRAAIRKRLPDAIDLLCVSVEAGVGFDGALQKVAEKLPGPLSDELQVYLREVNVGATRAEALEHLANRVGLAELRAFAGAIIQAEQLGTGLARALRVQSDEIRRRQKQRAEELAMQAPVKLVFPLVFCIFPSLLVIILGPAVLHILGAFLRP
ncbi:MAG: type II secretion system F family protein [Bacillota bacterium]